MNGGEVSAARSCANCHARLSGPYCAVCGQRHDPHVHSLREFLSEATESITHADSRLWRTLWPLLVKPGFLTKEFFEGRRARYLPPFRLYLVLSIVFFVLAAAGSGTAQLLELGTDSGKPVARVTETRPPASNPTESPAQRADRMCRNLSWGGPGQSYLEPRLGAACRKIVRDNGATLTQALYHNIPRALIVLLPLLALVMRALYRRRYYVEHLLFFVHTHSFTFLFLSLYVLVTRLIPWQGLRGLLTFSMLLLIPFYTYRAMRRFYAQGRWITRLKFSVLTLSYIVLSAIMVVLLSVYTMVTL